MAITTTMKRLSAFFLPVLLTCAFLASVNYALEPTTTTISSYGRTGSQTSNFLYGVYCSETPTPGTWAPSWETTHIDMIADAGGNHIIYCIDKSGWYSSLTVNGDPFQDYVAQIVSYSRLRNIKAVINLHSDYGFGDRNNDGLRWGSYEKNMQLNDPTLREEWIQWGRDILIECDPWGVIIMDEPGRDMSTESPPQPSSLQDYWDFANECITEWKKVKSDIVCISYGGGGSTGNRYLNQFHTNPLHTPNGPHDNVLYTTVLYYNTLDEDYAVSRANGYQEMLGWFDSHGVYGEIASRTLLAVGSRYYTSRWDWYMEDIYNWCFDNAYGLMPFTAACSTYYDPSWNLFLGPSAGYPNYDAWSEFGQFWVDHVPS